MVDRRCGGGEGAADGTRGERGWAAMGRIGAVD